MAIHTQDHISRNDGSSVHPLTTYDITTICEAARTCGLTQPGIPELILAHEMAESLIGTQIASPEALILAGHHSGVSCFVHKDGAQLTGAYAMLILSARGFMALQDGTFDGQVPNPAHLARPGERPAAHYGWGIAARTKPAAKALLTGIAAIHEAAFPTTHYVVRASTADGRRVIQANGVLPVPWGDPDLYWQPAGLEAAK